MPVAVRRLGHRARATRATRERSAAGTAARVGATVINPAASGTAASIAATQSAIATASPPRLKTRAPAGSDRLASSSVFATSSAYWNSVAPPNVISNGWPRTAAAIATVGLARHPLVAARAVDRHRPQADARDAGVVPVDPGVALVRQLVDAVVVAGMGVGVLLEPARDRVRRRSASTSRSSSCRRAAPSRPERRLTASKTLTVPTTLTRAPSGGSARQNGTCSAARWMTFVMPCSSSDALERRRGP